jgi:hypothetical protein
MSVERKVFVVGDPYALDSVRHRAASFRAASTTVDVTYRVRTLRARLWILAMRCLSVFVGRERALRWAYVGVARWTRVEIVGARRPPSKIEVRFDDDPPVPRSL